MVYFLLQIFVFLFALLTMKQREGVSNSWPMSPVFCGERKREKYDDADQIQFRCIGMAASSPRTKIQRKSDQTNCKF
jgi:hypothetical protein